MISERQQRENKCIRQPTGPQQGPENIRLLGSTFPTQNIKHGEVESPSEIKGVNCLETAILKNSLRSCPHRRNNCKLIKEDQGWELRSRPCGGGGLLCLPVLLLPWGPLSPGDGPRHGVLSLRTSFPPPLQPYPKTGCWHRQPPRGNLINKTYTEDKGPALANGQKIAIGCTCRANWAPQIKDLSISHLSFVKGLCW